MRVGSHPYKDKPNEQSEYLHQVIIPVYIPEHDGYFKDSFKILKLCLSSLFKTIHNKTFVTIVNNGSDNMIKDYLNDLHQKGKIHELIHSINIGKINAILKGLNGNNIELVTIADSDVLFLAEWQKETNLVFSAFPKAGVVGIVPQYKTYNSKCENLLFDNLFNKNLKFIPITNPQALEDFYTSIGWGKSNPDYLKLALGLKASNGLQAYVGSGHFVATYKKDMFDEIVTYIGYKMGGDSERYLDLFPLKKDYWRLTTCGNYAFHMGNVFEQWMEEVDIKTNSNAEFQSNFPTYKKCHNINYFIKNHLFRKLFKIEFVKRLFYRYKGMPRNIIREY